MNNFQRIIQFLVDFRHQIYIYLGLFLIAVAFSRMSLIEFVTTLKIDNKVAFLYFGTILMFGSMDKNLQKLGFVIFILSLLVGIYKF